MRQRARDIYDLAHEMSETCTDASMVKTIGVSQMAEESARSIHRICGTMQRIEPRAIDREVVPVHYI